MPRDGSRSSLLYCGRTTPRPFDFGSVEGIVGVATVSALARLLDVQRLDVYRWRRIGLTEVQADVLAVRIGRHPSEVWGEAWWSAA